MPGPGHIYNDRLQSDGGKPLKGRIRRKDASPSEAVVFQFNPTEFSVNRAIQWSEAQQKGANTSKLEFKGGQPAQVSLSLMFDTTDCGHDVRSEFTNALWKLAMVDPKNKNARSKKAEPPHVLFEWGKGQTLWTFEAVITQLNQKFTMFLADGTPVRSTVDLTLKQAKDVTSFPAQNPTSGGVEGQRVRVLVEGETLDRIAVEEYGDANQWRHLALANNVDDPRRLEPGQTLIVPPVAPVRLKVV